MCITLKWISRKYVMMWNGLNCLMITSTLHSEQCVPSVHITWKISEVDKEWYMILGVDIWCFRDSCLWKQRVYNSGFCKVWRSYVTCHWENSSKCDVSLGKQFQMFWISTRNHSWTAWSWRLRHYDPTECLESLAQWQTSHLGTPESSQWSPCLFSLANCLRRLLVHTESSCCHAGLFMPEVQ